MSVFQDEVGDDGQQYAHLQAAAAQQQQQQIGGGHMSATALPVHSSPFGGNDGFATPSTRSVSNSVVDSSIGRNASSSITGSSAAPYGSAAASSTLSDVATSAPSRLATLAALPAYSLQPPESEIEAASKSRHGKIVVGEPELRSSTFSSYHVYKVSSAAGAVEHVFRRYTDFVWLRATLVSAFPGVFIPPLPEKKALGNRDSTFVESRRLDLQRWLHRVVSREFLAEHEAVSLFLHRATASYETDCKALTKSVEARPIKEIISNYMDLFPELARLPSSESAAFDVEAVRDFLVQAENKMRVLEVAADKFVGSNYTCVADLDKVNTALQANVEGEKAFLATAPAALKESGPGAVAPRVDIVDSFVAWNLSLKWTSNAYDDLLLIPLKFELQDIQAMSEAVKARFDLSARHAKSVAKAAKWTAAPGNAPKNEKQEAAKTADEEQAKDEGLLLDLTNKLILHAQFEQFWSWRMQQFRTRLHAFARAQIDATKQLHDTWTQIAAATAGTA